MTKNRGNNSQLLRRRPSNRLIVMWCYYLLLLSVFAANNTNYYELLNLETPETHRPNSKKQLNNRKKRSSYRARITNDQVKKAYRKQAQLYHPDKASRNNMTVEEATSRFARIAEAYQVLSDHVQRYEYDRDLIDAEEEEEEERLFQLEKQQMMRDRQNYEHGQQPQNNVRVRASDLHAWKDYLNNIDPWRVFEDFFFRESTLGDSNAYHNRDSTTDQFNYKARNPPNKNYGHNQAPNVSETTVHRGFDPYMGADVYTVYRREDYQNGSYKVIGQDFVSGVEVDPYTGFVLQQYYSAITEPYLVEEGSNYSYFDGGENQFVGDIHYEKLYEQIQKQQFDTPYQEPKPRRSSSSRLDQGESISINDSSDHWLSPNGKFQAYLSPTCELQIIRRVHESDKNTEGETTPDNMVVWSSDTYIPDTRAHGCHLTLNSLGRLVLSIDYGSGLGQVGNSVLWNSPMPPVVPYWVQGNQQHSVTFYYYASLDDDGVIAIYRVRETADSGKNQRKGQSARPRVIDALGDFYGRISKTSTECGQTKASLAYDQLRRNVGSLFLGRPRSAGTASSKYGGRVDENPRAPNNVQFHHECVYSTSPVGCIAPGRNMIHLTKKLARSIKHSVKTMDSRLDNLISKLTQPTEEYDYDGYGAYDGYGYPTRSYDDDDDADILDTLLRVTGAAGKIGLEQVQVGVKQGKKVAGKVVGKMKDKIERMMYSFDDNN